MNADKLKTSPNADDELDDPYIHTLSTEEFVENVEQASHKENNEELTPNKEWLYSRSPGLTLKGWRYHLATDDMHLVKPFHERLQLIYNLH